MLNDCLLKFEKVLTLNDLKYVIDRDAYVIMDSNDKVLSRVTKTIACNYYRWYGNFAGEYFVYCLKLMGKENDTKQLH